MKINKYKTIIEEIREKELDKYIERFKEQMSKSEAKAILFVAGEYLYNYDTMFSPLAFCLLFDVDYDNAKQIFIQLKTLGMIKQEEETKEYYVESESYLYSFVPIALKKFGIKKLNKKKNDKDK